MKRLMFVITLALTLCANVFAQAPHKDHRKEVVQRFMAEKTAYFTEKLQLTPEQAERFWPLYNSIHEEQRSVFKEVRKKKWALIGAVKEGKSDAEIAVLLSEWIASEQSTANPMFEHRAEFVAVLGEAGTARLYLAEEGFRNQVIRKLAGHEQE